MRLSNDDSDDTLGSVSDGSRQGKAPVARDLSFRDFPMLGRKPVGEVTAPQLLAMDKRIESRGALDIAKRALQTCGHVLRYVVAHGST